MLLRSLWNEECLHRQKTKFVIGNLKFPFLTSPLLLILNCPLSINSCGRMRLRMNIWGSAFQAGSRCWSTPQNEFCGYENSAFQAKKYPRRQKSIVVETFNSPPHLCLKGNNIFRSTFCNCFIITFSHWIHWHIGILNSCLKGNNFHNRRSPTCGQRHRYPSCLKGRTFSAVLYPHQSKRNQRNSNL